MPRIKSFLKPFHRHSAPGTSPGTVMVREGEPKPVISVLAYSDGHLVDEVVDSVEGLEKLTQNHQVTWINIEGLGDAQMIYRLGEMFGLHWLALEDVVNVHQRPKVEDYEGHLFIVARMVEAEPELQTEQICFFVGPKFLLTFQEGKPGDCLDPVRQRIRNCTGRIRYRGTDYLTYALLDSIIDHYFPVVEAYGEQLDQLDDVLMSNPDNASIGAIRSFRKELLYLRRIVRPHREAINQLLRDSHELITDETRIFLRDCYDHTIQLSDAIDTYRELCSDLRDFHLSAMSNRTNDVMKTLTIIATIFIPLGFIAGVYGMNFDDMPELHWKYGYPAVMLFMGSIAGGLLLWFRQKGWFEG